MHAEAKRLEAEFFLSKLRDVPHNSDDFCYYLSALTSAFRSVTFAIQFEYSKDDRFEAIYDPFRSELMADNFARGMKDARNSQLHQGHAWPRVVIYMKQLSSGRIIEPEYAPLPNGFENLRSVRFITPPELCIPLGDDPEHRSMMIMRQILQDTLALRGRDWVRSLRVKIDEKSDAVPIADFFESAAYWLGRFRSVIERLERNRPCVAMHHVLNKTEATLIESVQLSDP
ncbi:hypothetical protein [Dyella sp. 20L07]|uniref:hypothetical protein n=1 Tax=Dyella sp. 20L07 TaxID=3384240 RepID=UPI003D2BD3F8